MIVTGGGRGLGRAMALGLAAGGAQVVVTAARKPQELASLAEAAKGKPGRIVPVVADITREDDAAIARMQTERRIATLLAFARVYQTVAHWTPRRPVSPMGGTTRSQARRPSGAGG